MVSLIVIYVGIKIRSLTKNGSFKNTLSCLEYLSQVVLVLNMSRDEKLLIKSHINVFSTK